jgi:uncharacterized protein YceK
VDNVLANIRSRADVLSAAELRRLDTTIMLTKTRLILPLVFLLSGCASTLGNISYSEFERDVGTRVYIGTKIDSTFLASPFRLSPKGEAHQSWGMSLLIWPFALIDLPLSFAVDTLLLPYTLNADSKKEEK